jgi:ubiquinone/menaquinone biosynthesis C-methylase UbiE
MSLMISVITPSFNSGPHLKRAIASVTAQNYRRWEHIVVDGGSTDGTLEILKESSRLTWVSEPDEGQVHAMQKGFAMARGDVVVYLNADDYFLKKAFATAVKAFETGVMMVVGQVRVDVEKDGSTWVNDPRIDLESMLRHWEMNAYCYNPVGYFIRRELQERVPFNADNPDKHDFEFLIEAVKRFPDAIVKVDRVFGVFCMREASRTSKEQARPDYWRPWNFPFVERALADTSPEFRRIFPSLRDCGYQTQTQWAIHDVIRQGRAGDWARQGKLISLPVDGVEANIHMGFAEKLNHLVDGDIVVCVLSAAGDEGKPLAQFLRTLPDHISAYPVYHLCLSGVERPMAVFLDGGQLLQDYVSVAAVQQAWKRYKDRLRWKFILLCAEPVAWALAALGGDSAGDAEPDSGIQEGWRRIEDNLMRVFLRLTSIDLLGTEVDVREGFTVVRAGNAEVLMCHDCGSQEVIRQAFLEFLGIPGSGGFGDPEGAPLPALDSWAGVPASEPAAPRVGPRVLDEVYGSPVVQRFMSSKAIAVGRAHRLNGDIVAESLAAGSGIGLAPYQLEFVVKTLQHTAVAGKRILEIGSDNDLFVGKALARLGAAQMQCSNMVDFSKAMENCDDDRVSFAHCAGQDLPFENDSFDLVVGCALLEHVTVMEAFARELHRIVAPGGHVFLHGAPMWPSRVGHHVYFIGNARFYKFTDETNPVPDYGHLTMAPAQLAEHLAGSDMPREDRDRIVNYAYEDDVLNRMHPDAIVAAFGEVFDVVEDFRWPDTPFPDEVCKRLLDPAIAAGNEVYTLELFLKKPDRARRRARQGGDVL